MRFRFHYIFLICLLSAPLIGQNLLVNDSNGDLVSIDINGCNTDVVTDIGFYTDIAAHPNGFFYGVNSVGKLSRINVMTGEIIQVEDFTSTAYYALTANADGLLFAASGLGDLVSYNPSNNTTVYYDNMGYNAAGDLTYYQGDMYMATDENNLVYIDPFDPSNNEVFIDFASSNSSIYGIVSTVDGCDVSTYAFSNDNNAKVYQIDWINKTFDFVCNIDKEVYGGSSEFEFAASDDLIKIDSIVVNVSPCEEGTSSLLVYATSEIGELMYSIDGVNYQISNEFDNLNSGNYTIYIQDVSGCVGNEEVDISAGFLEVEEVSIVNAICGQANGTATINVNSSTTDLSYSIDGINFQISSTFTGLPPGLYDVIILSSQACESAASFEISVSSSIELINSNAFGPSCDEGLAFIDVEAQSPNGGLMYSLDGINFQDDPYFGDLSADSYTLYMLDAAGCTDSFEVNIASAVLELVNVVTSPETCQSSNGTANLLIESSLPSFEIFLDGVSQSNNVSLQNLDSGEYLVELIGADGCETIYDLVIEEISTYELDTILTTPDFCSQSMGAIDIQLNDNGNSVSYFLNSNLEADANITDLEQGVYTLQISDQNNCITNYTVNIEEDDCPIFIPNVFAPALGGNGTFSLKSAYDLTVEDWYIYDRWGNMVFQAHDFNINDVNVSWDGMFNSKEVLSGVYIFSVTINGFVQPIVGDVTLIR